jgi:hypothetical protein
MSRNSAVFNEFGVNFNLAVKSARVATDFRTSVRITIMTALNTGRLATHVQLKPLQVSPLELVHHRIGERSLRARLDSLSLIEESWKVSGGTNGSV